MTHRQARRKLGSRTARRAGTKTQVIPGGAQKKPPKYSRPKRHAKVPTLAARVRQLVRTHAAA